MSTGSLTTYVVYRLWCESDFAYHEYVENVSRSGTDPGSIHNPPMCYVLSTRVM